MEHLIQDQLHQLSDRHASALRMFNEREKSTDEKLQQLSERHAAGVRQLGEMEHAIKDQLQQLSDRHAATLRKFSEMENSAGEKLEQLSQRHAATLDKLISLEQQRKEKINQLLAIRKERKSLEKLRARAVEEYRKEQNRQEQMMTDETGCTTYARTLIQSSQDAAVRTDDNRKIQAELFAVQMSR